MSQETLCNQIKTGMKELLRSGTELAKAGEIAEYGGVPQPKQEGAEKVGYHLRLHLCDDFDDVGYEVIENNDDSNDYHFWWE